MTQQEFARKYLLKDIIKRNLRFWWLLILCGVVVAGLLGYKKYNDYQTRFYKMSLKGVVDTYTMNFYTGNMKQESVAQRINTLTEIVTSREAYEDFIKLSGYDMEYGTYTEIVRFDNNNATDILSGVFTFPWGNGDFEVIDDKKATEFTDYFSKALVSTCNRILKDNSVEYLGISEKGTFDHNASDSDKALANKAIIKNAFIGFAIGVIIPVVVITLIYLLSGKLNTASAIALCLDTKLLMDVKKEDYSKLSTLIPLYEYKRNGKVCKINFINIAQDDNKVATKFAELLKESGKNVSFDKEQSQADYVISMGYNNFEDSLKADLTVVVAATGMLKEDYVEETARILSLYDIVAHGVIVYEPVK